MSRDVRRANHTPTRQRVRVGAPVMVSRSNPQQCSCKRSQSFYVKGVEEMYIAFEHSYRVTSQAASESEADGNRLAGVSSAVECNVTAMAMASAPAEQQTGCARWPLHTRVLFADGSEQTFRQGEPVRLPLKALLALAGTQLDATNSDVMHDCRRTDPACGGEGKPRADGSAPPRYPKYRTTGLRINVDLLYTNRQGYYEDDFNLAPLYSANVTARVNATHVRTGWAGMGPDTAMIEMPSVDEEGVEEGVSLTRYRQGVVIVFSPTGKIYAFSFDHFFSTVCAQVNAAYSTPIHTEHSSTTVPTLIRPRRGDDDDARVRARVRHSSLRCLGRALARDYLAIATTPLEEERAMR